ncbi:hypothetical protein ACERK3_10295 [Phycisphaerales bacterium AB-hyl4]|uniref:Uncharacterized protein n=1 Tax=Natronomicrosphaera hydrolytica TaxID=3242702 RepID=A0ABV4U566_9BACT
MRWMATLLYVLIVSPAFAGVPAVFDRSIDETLGDLRRVVADVDQRRTAHYHAQLPGSDELHRRSLSAYRALELARGLLADYRAELVRVAGGGAGSDAQPTPPDVPATDAPTLPPGEGFEGETDQPDHVGSGFGADAKAIARWNLVPWPIFDQPIGVGVLAYHMIGIDRVEFSANGGAWVAVDETSLNPHTGVDEYWVQLDPADFEQGDTVEVRAIVYPTTGYPRVLQGEINRNYDGLNTGVHSMVLYAYPDGVERHELFVAVSGDDDNSGTRDEPMRSIGLALRKLRDAGHADYGVVTIIEPGFYELPNYPTGHDPHGPVSVGTSRWLTIRGDDSLDREEIVLGRAERSDARMRLNRSKWQNVSFDFGTIVQIYLDGSRDGQGHAIWFDDVRWFDRHGPVIHRDDAPGRRQQLYPIRAETGHRYVTNSAVEDMLYGFVGLTYARNVTATNISGDSLANTQMIVGASVGGSDGEALEFHSDVLQFFGHYENLVITGVNATGLNAVQSIFLDHHQSSFTDCAFVDLTFENINDQANGGPPWSQLNSRHENVLFKRVALPYQRLVFRDDFEGARQFQADGPGVLFRDCELHPQSHPLRREVEGVRVRQ